MKSAIPKLERRIKELKDIDLNTVNKQFDPRFESLKCKTNDTLMEVFGSNSIEYDKYEVWGLDNTPMVIGEQPYIEEIRKGLQEGIEENLYKLNTIKELFVEKLEDLGETVSGRALRAFGGLGIHPQIERVASGLF
jgi:hypothetical protein